MCSTAVLHSQPWYDGVIFDVTFRLSQDLLDFILDSFQLQLSKASPPMKDYDDHFSDASPTTDMSQFYLFLLQRDRN